MKTIELNIGESKALYNSQTRIVTHLTNSGVMMECEVPKNWALTRIFQFMNSLLKNSSKLI